MADDAIVDELPRAVLSKLPAVPNYPAPLPPSLEEEPVYVGPDLGSDSEDEDSAVETGDYETVHHEPLTEAQAMDSLKDMKTVIGKEGRIVYAYEAKLPPLPAPLLPPDEDVDAGYDPFRSSLPDASAAPSSKSETSNVTDLSHITDWSPIVMLQAYFRAQLTRGWFARRRTMIFHRNSVAKEILSTEQTYVQNLKIVTGIYMAPLQASFASESPLVTEEEYQKLFPRLDIIIGLNTELLGAIFDRVSHWDDHTCLADIFLRMAAFFKMYTEYCSKYEESAAMYRHLVKSRPEFASFLSKVENLQDIHGLDLPSFLILPCQRIPRYLMLITELNRWTWADHPDKANLEKAVEKWQEVVTHVNDSMDEAARMNQLLHIERKFNNMLNLVVPHRKFIKQGPIHKITSRIVVTPTYFLFTDIMVYGYPNADESEVKYKGTIQLGTAWVRNLADTDDLQNGFQLVTPDKAYTLYFDTPKEKRSWMIAIESCINRLVAIDPMLVTKRATQVKKTTRVGQALWNLFTKDTDPFTLSEDALIKEQVSSMNLSLAETIGKRSLMPIRTSLELDWTEVRNKSLSPAHSSSSIPQDESQADSAPPRKGNHGRGHSTTSSPSVDLLQPEIVPSAQVVNVKQGIRREEDPGEAQIGLDEVIASPSLSRPQATRPTTNRTTNKLVGNDKQYSPLLGQQNSRYGTHIQEPHSSSDSTCCAGCTIL
jgi:hypothetical protein